MFAIRNTAFEIVDIKPPGRIFALSIDDPTGGWAIAANWYQTNHQINQIPAKTQSVQHEIPVAWFVRP